MIIMMGPLFEKLAQDRTPICLKTALNTENWSVKWKILQGSPRLKYVFDPSPIRRQQVGQSGLLKMSRIERKHEMSRISSPTLFGAHLAIPSQLLETLRLDPVADPLRGADLRFTHLRLGVVTFLLTEKLLIKVFTSIKGL